MEDGTQNEWICRLKCKQADQLRKKTGAKWFLAYIHAYVRNVMDIFSEL